MARSAGSARWWEDYFVTTHAPQIEAVVDLDAIAHNVRVLRRAAPTAAVMVVVKADGYGHGALQTAQAALAAGAREIGVTTVEEALDLRAGGVTAPILCWLNVSDTDFAPAVAADVEIGVSSVQHLRAVAAAARSLGRRAIVSVKVDTGLNRNGASPQEYPRVLDELRASESDVTLRAIFTHLANADRPRDPVIDVQKQRFMDAIAAAKAAGLQPDLVHMANSACTLTRPDLHFDMVRPGIAVYGLSPIPEESDFGLRPAMTLRARVALVKEVAAGEGVSYGHEWIAQCDTVVALLPVGYADGLPRALGGRFAVSIGGTRYPAIGRVCMDQFVVDLGGPTDIREGDTATLFGPGDGGEETATDWAGTLGTINYEIVTMPRGRVVRTFAGGTQ